MKSLRISNSNLLIKKNKNESTLKTVYGIGRIRSKKIITFLLTNPRAKQFKNSLVNISQELKTQRIFKSFILDNNLKLLVYNSLEKLARISCYRSHRILQNLPSKGQRTHTNSGTPNQLNPFLKLGVKINFTKELIDNNKKWELNWNNRSTDVNKISRRKYSKSASLAKKAKKEKKNNKAKKTKKK